MTQATKPQTRTRREYAPAGRQFIYGLVCPLQGRIVYVGKTGDSLRGRLSNHFSDHCAQVNPPFLAWKEQLRSAGLTAEIVLLSTPPALKATEAERHWIRYYNAKAPLLNKRAMIGEVVSGPYDLVRLNEIRDYHGLTTLCLRLKLGLRSASVTSFLNGTHEVVPYEAGLISAYLLSLPTPADTHEYFVRIGEVGC